MGKEKSIVGFEFKKICKVRWVWIFFIILLFGNLFALYLHEKNTPAYHYIFEQRVEYESYLKGNREVDRDGFYQEDEEKQKEYAATYPVFLEGMTERAKGLEGLSAFSREDSFVYRNLEKTCKDFEPLYGTVIEQDNCFGVRKFASYNWGFFFFCIFLAILSYVLFYQERNRGLLLLLKGTKNGHVPLITAKVAVMFFISAGYLLLQEISSAWLLGYFYGYGNWNRSVQSVSEFRNCPKQMTVLGLLVGMIVVRLVLAELLALLIFVISISIRNELLAISCGGAILAAEYWLYQGLDLSGSLNGLKCSNLFFCWNARNVFGTYVNLNIFGHAVGKEQCTVVIATILAILFLAGGILKFHFSYQIHTKSRLEKVQLWIRKKLGFLWRHVGIFRFECWKVLFQQKKCFVLLLSGIICCVEVRDVTGNQYYDSLSVAVYHSYLSELHGKVTDESIKFVADEQEYVKELERQLEALGDTTTGKNMFLAQQLKTEFESKGEAVEMLVAQLDALRQKEGSIYEKYWVDEQAYLSVWYDVGTDLSLGAVGLIGTILWLSGIYPADEKKGMVPLLRSTRWGRERLCRKKNGCAVIGTILMFFLAELPIGIRYFLIDNGQVLGQKMSDLTLLALRGNLTMGVFLIVVFLGKALLFAATSYTGLLLSRKCGNEMVTNIIAIGTIGILLIVLYYFRMDISTTLLSLLW